MLTPARRSTSTKTPIRPHAMALGTPSREQVRLRVDGPETLPGPHVHRAARDATRQPGDDAQWPADSRLGFLAIAETAEHAFLGGYLVTNPWGRPVEFHCTEPVKPNRAQQILFGPTLASVLFGELMAATLIEKASAAPALVLTQQRDVLSARPLVEVPIVCLDPAASPSSSNPGDGGDASVHALAQVATLVQRPKPPRCCPRFEHDARTLDAFLRHRERIEDLHEPFQRIHLCLEEVFP